MVSYIDWMRGKIVIVIDLHGNGVMFARRESKYSMTVEESLDGNFCNVFEHAIMY